ncbi:septal ring lytic transglycosylase RlpA family protein [Paraglaciecola aquimarina]|uniref:Endolytic peptidoglycan transglycosylase RlpA n=1 Tax=Paraglaciecola aquimarina TaxID=1235557 RepID=A0ABU3SZM3_9ALTE|nr:septal ring lytic transglycosylase RlpA family protein [Paraglaciecola aquimarina]MDU0355466.1 septal ring lytic transglycosylase RlpA family protein [Paraglaciecola aquimarina]
MRDLTHPLVIILLCTGLLSCAPKGRYHQHHDSAPKVVPHDVTQEDAIPRFEPYARANMKPYTIRGVNYTPLKTGLGYSDSGKASWYGEKFHGHQTANGEIYDMYQMSAAHKTLPLPSFARITNLDNGKQVVVRVNDRGPFHIRRIVDLSYAAAQKLDVIATGTANVKLDVIHVSETGEITIGNQKKLIAASPSPITYIQVLALKNKKKLVEIGEKLQRQYNLPYRVLFANNIHKLQLGPLSTKNNTASLLRDLKKQHYPNAYPIYKK